MTSTEQGPVLVAGASGFVGRRLVPALVEAGHDVRAMTRHPDGYDGQGTAVHGDVHDASTLPAALEGCRAAYYLVHSLDSKDFERLDAEAATAFGKAAADAGVRQIVYLGGLGSESDDLSVAPAQPTRGRGAARRRRRPGHRAAGRHHRRRRRHLVGDDPSARRPPAGDGHAAAGCAPGRSRSRSTDVVRYLVGVLDRDAAIGQVFEIGGPEVLQYVTMLRRVATIKNRRLLIVPVPLLTPGLSSRWLSLVTDVDTQAGRSLVDSMANEVVVRDDSIRSVVPFEPMGYDDAVRTALEEHEREAVAR